MIEDKIILDACCGSKMLWFEKNHPSVVYADIRDESHTLCDGRSLEIKPDMLIDFRKMPFRDESFKMVVFDPPHLNKLGKSSWMAKKYGVLNYHWRDDIRQGFDECMRVLQTNGFLIFKWNESQIKIKDVIDVVGCNPLFGHTTGRQAKTIWMCFIKPNSEQEDKRSVATKDAQGGDAGNQTSLSKEEGKDEGWVHRFNSEQEFLNFLKQGQEIESLKQWKAEAMSVMPDFQEIGKILGVKLGEDVSSKIIPELKRYRQEITRLKGLLEQQFRGGYHNPHVDAMWHQFAKENGLKGE